MNPSSTQTGTLGKVQSKKPAKGWSAFGRKKIGKLAITAKNKVIALKVGVIVLVIALLSLGSWRVSAASEGKILPKVTIAGLKVGGETPSEAKKIVQNYITTINSQGPQITYADKTIQPKLTDMGISFDVDKVVNDAYNFGRHGSWTQKIKDNFKMIFTKHNMTLPPQIDEKKFDELLGQVAQVVEIPPVNATLIIENGNISLSPSKIGRGLDKTKLKADLTKMINSGQVNSKIVLITSDLQPAIKEDGTLEARAQAEKYMSAAPIVATFEDQTWTANKAEIGKWIKFVENGTKIVATPDPSSFVSSIAKKVEIADKDKEIQDGTGAVLDEGQDGRGMDTKTLTNQIMGTLKKYQSATFGVITFVVPRGEKIIYPHAQPCRYPGHYADINLSEQTLYAFDGCTLVNQFLISGGKTGRTPTGEFHVYSQDRVTRMSGPGYDLPGVEWVSWFYADYSIHGTYWHNNFGHPMSHGCVNASNGDAEWFYSWGGVGTPVYIHY